MEFCEITLSSVPKIIFAYSVTSDHYRNRFPSYPDLLEVSVIEEGTIHYAYDSGGFSDTPPGTLAPILRDMHCRTYTDNNVLQRHITVGTVAKYTLTRRHTSEISDPVQYRSSVKKNGTILIPYQWDLGIRCADVIHMLKRIILAHTSVEAPLPLDALSEWFHLMGVLTELVLCRIEGREDTHGSPREEYVRRAKQYLAEHYAENPSVSDVAGALGISVGYLHGIFKDLTGFSIIEYLNRYRIGIVKEALYSRRISLKEASYLVGIDDPSYMSRLFKKVEGISFRRYCAGAPSTKE